MMPSTSSSGRSPTPPSVQAAPQAELDLAPLPRLRAIAAEWGLIGPTLNELGNLREVVTWQLGDTDLRAFRDDVELRRVVVKDARALEALSARANDRAAYHSTSCVSG